MGLFWKDTPEEDAEAQAKREEAENLKAVTMLRSYWAKRQAAKAEAAERETKRQAEQEKYAFYTSKEEEEPKKPSRWRLF